MFNRSSIISSLRALELPSDGFWVIMGAALVLHGVRPTCTDIDLGCSQHLAHSLLEMGYMASSTSSGHPKLILADGVHLYGGWVSPGLDWIDGIQVASLSSIRSDKMRLGRPKDLVDVQLIDARMAANEAD